MFIIISAPSGGGKNSVIKELLKKYSSSHLAITTTTRLPRKKEKNFQDYFFISKKEFEKKIANNDFVEYNFYNDNYYGLEKAELTKNSQKYKIVFLAIDVNGKKSFDKAKIFHYSIFLLPESLEILKKRIKDRGDLDQKQIIERLKTAKKELNKAKKYDFQIINKQGSLDKTVLQITKIIDKLLLA